MERYRYDSGMLEVYACRVNEHEDDEGSLETEDIDGYQVFDTRRGNGPDDWLAFTRDPDIAAHLVRLLNEAERKET